MASPKKTTPANAYTKAWVSVRLTPYHIERIREIADAHNMSRSVVLRTVLELGLRQILDERGYERKGK